MLKARAALRERLEREFVPCRHSSRLSPGERVVYVQWNFCATAAITKSVLQHIDRSSRAIKLGDSS